MKPIFFLLGIITTQAYAEDIPSMSKQDMNNMMQQFMQVQQCMQNVDQAALHHVEQQTIQFTNEVKALCAAGKRDEAQSKAMAFGQSMKDKPVIKSIQKCGNLVRELLPSIPMSENDMDSTLHVCDSNLDATQTLP